MLSLLRLLLQARHDLHAPLRSVLGALIDSLVPATARLAAAAATPPPHDRRETAYERETAGGLMDMVAGLV